MSAARAPGSRRVLLALWAWTGAALLLLYLPMVPPPLFSLGEGALAQTLSAPSLQAYADLTRQEVLSGAVINSLLVAAVVGVVTPVLAILAAMAVREWRVPRLVMGLVLLPLFVPGVSMGLATAVTLRWLDIDTSLATICMVNILWALPFAFLIVLTSMSTFDTTQLEAATMLGASPWRAFRDIELPAIRAGALGACTFSMILSFNETSRTALVQGPNNTVQTYIWAMYKQVGLSPTLYALMTVLMVLTLGLALGFWALGKRSRPAS